MESKRNVRKKFNEKQKQRLNTLILKSGLKVVEDVHINTIMKYEDVISAKDAPVLAVAHALKVVYLVTHNTKDFMKQDVRNRIYPIQVLTPKKFVHLVEKQIGR
ncbi:hypothetical protein CO051_01340 [Candidatus Roizmanbacteria bacterium CG_4_9_14_0_2_um_filter_39_13]|uniref:PIN domain-containing protein n=1 Tax=Candidatus Roizmanbacteria bacterium CG_4_9_14_0_2_um_filter_39_13 TaxID=1974839 RepID=A0A2M8F2S7_9BACT|nr:MAG: hypothetical protein COU64_04375 [Candidatus Pacebacteria bacterium CG10_big_fil_rev_8_21_14_0_10_40_26]PIZ66759.1 MAG: hypothetical protein COY15_00185 [Candidatus Roizmanbacteria bacterium CG_4_10_14_0_2_um_filter_39_12]PJC33586.1 MAG: hypothetical protein CO051_01340 [Candidatus Roizmanbacteria bacterium CG_4_9_14_0_2_um_filter_39_13]